MERLRWINVKYTREALGNPGVTSKGLAARYFKVRNPKTKVKAISRFKFDHDTDSVSLRLGVTSPAGSGPDDPKTEVAGKTSDYGADGKDREVKLLSPGYDELADELIAAKADICGITDMNQALVSAQEHLEGRIKEFKAENDRLILRLAELEPAADNSIVTEDTDV